MKTLLNNLDKNKCTKGYKPFSECQIHHGGIIYPCCPDFTCKFKFGNLLTENFEEIWNGKFATEFRLHLLQNDYSVCDLKTCYTRTNVSNDQIKECYKNDGKVKLSQKVSLCFDNECNCACITCRDKIIVNSTEEEKKLNKIKEKIWPILVQCKRIDTSGDPFASRYMRSLIKEVNEVNEQVKCVCTSSKFKNSS